MARRRKERWISVDFIWYIVTLLAISVHSRMKVCFTNISLWHKVDISNFQCHKNVNFHNNFVGLMIADDLKSKI